MQQNEVIGNRIMELCMEKNMTLRMLGEQSGLTYRRVYRLAHGGHTDPSIFTILRICDTMGITVDEFVSTEEFKEYRI